MRGLTDIKVSQSILCAVSGQLTGKEEIDSTETQRSVEGLFFCIVGLDENSRGVESNDIDTAHWVERCESACWYVINVDTAYSAGPT